MAHISGFQVIEKLYESSRSVVYRARRERDAQPFIIKMLASPYPSSEKIAWFQREYETTRALSSLKGVIRAHELLNEQQRWLMVLEDIGGTSLALLMRERRLTLEEVLSLAMSLAGLLGEVHRRHVIHKDINPSNIILNPNNGQFRLIDFGISSVLSQESTPLRDPRKLEGTLAYMSPEQTGRMNRAVDYRTDLYSLGATLYELLAEQPPFTGMDPLEFVHAHITRQPRALHELRADVDRALSDIVLKLLAKNAEDRYQSAYGLLRDLEEYRRRSAAGQVEPFQLGREDASDQFQLPQKLYGREKETQLLLDAFERVAASSSEVMLISGYSGVGKSSLVREVYKPITRQRGYFISGKFDQLLRDEPYAPLLQAFRSLAYQILSETNAQLARWREQLSAVLGPNGRVITDVIPEVEGIIGPQPPLMELEPGEAKNRFRLVFQSFIKVFAQREHPLVLFVDDLQWVDAASLELLQILLTSTDNQHLFLIGAYRDNEVGELHPLRLSMAQLRKAGVPIQELSLQPLGFEHVHQFIFDTISLSSDDTQSLAHLVHTKTGGNPFFLGEFLKHLVAEGLLHFDLKHRSWWWNLEQIATRGMTDNVITLMVEKVRKLGPASLQALEFAACMGNVFELRTLAVILEKAPRAAARDLKGALTEGLIQPLDDTYKLVDFDIQGLIDTINVKYRFSHDRIQQAAYSVIPDEERRRIHWRLGKLMLESVPANKLEQRVFDIVHQFSQGLEYARERPEREELARLYLLAGRRAKAAAAYEPALRYLRTGIRLLSSPDVTGVPASEYLRESWRRQYRLCLELFDEAAEKACMVGEYEELQQLLSTTLTHTESLLDRVHSYKVEIQSFAARKRLLDGIRTGLRALTELGIEIPAEPDAEIIGRTAAAAAAAWAGRDIDKLLELPEMKAPEKLAAMELLARLYIPAFNAAPGVYVLAVLNQVILSLTHGVTANSPRGFAAYGFMLCSQGDVASGYRFGMLAPRLADRFQGRDKSSAIFMFNCFVRHWRDSFLETIEPFFEGYQCGLESGDLEFAALNLAGFAPVSFWSGRTLPGLASQCESHSRTIRNLKQEMSQKLNEVIWQASLNLLGKSADPCAMIGEVYDERPALSAHDAHGNMNELANLHVCKLALCYLFGEYERAVEHARAGRKYSAAITSTVVLSSLYFYEALACLAHEGALGSAKEEGLLEQADESLKQLRIRGDSAPSNYEHKVCLVEAERARVRGRTTEARELYDRAIVLAQKNHFIQDEALACELAASFHRAQGLAHLARHYLRDANYAYQRWGALAKARQLEARFPQELARPASRSFPNLSPKGTTTQQFEGSNALDLLSVLKASQALSGELALDRLLAKLLTTVLENAGAQKASLLFEKEGKLVIEAEGSTEGGEMRVLQSTPVEASDNLLLALVSLVARSGKPEVVSDASKEGLFTLDPYVQRTRPKSILCMPLVNQGKRAAILYLENNLLSGAFSHERIEVLNLLSAEMAIAIDNARLYRQLAAANAALEAYSHTLEDKVAARTSELADKNQELQRTLAQLRETQQMLVLREKMASLGTLTAGIAHEIRNPLNFIINFAELIREQAEELTVDFSSWRTAPDARRLDSLQASLGNLRDNASSIEAHGRRAAGIVHTMQLHSQAPGQERLDTDLNRLVNESIQFSLHAIRARSGNIPELMESYAANLGLIPVMPQELGRVITNLIDNACYSVEKKRQLAGSGYEPRIWVSTASVEQSVEVRIRDNGMGIAREHLEKIFQPFFTTKPPGEGTGLGLSISYDIVVHKHQGDLRAESQEGEYAEFLLRLPTKQSLV